MELFDLYDDERRLTGETIERGAPLPESRYHLVIHICILGSDGKMLIQQRNRSKRVSLVNGTYRSEGAQSQVKTAGRRQVVSCTRSSA